MRTVALIATCAALVSCDTGPAEVLPMCGTDAVISVGSGTQPTVSWTPNCAATWAWVETLPRSTGGIVPIAWQKYAPEGSFRSPVRVKTDSTIIMGPEEVELVQGQRYQACLINDGWPGWSYLSCTEFTP